MKVLTMLANSIDNNPAAHLVRLRDAHPIYKIIRLMFLGNKTAESFKVNKQLSELKFEGSYYWLINTFIQLTSKLENLGNTLDYKNLLLMLFDEFPQGMFNFSYNQKLTIENSVVDRLVFDQKIDAVMRYLVERGVYRPTEKPTVYSSVAQSKRCPKCNLTHRSSRCPKRYECGKTGHSRRYCPIRRHNTGQNTNNVRTDHANLETSEKTKASFIAFSAENEN
eukprot:snap_masked-scaffold_3-processed-gene-2.3-mRNA-1 protein AED:1.00 eAED:1.00 QI:0/-1/0/0/-1/1/1/0/222